MRSFLGVEMMKDVQSDREPVNELGSIILDLEEIVIRLKEVLENA